MRFGERKIGSNQVLDGAVGEWVSFFKSNENPFTALKRRSFCVMMNTNVHKH